MDNKTLLLVLMVVLIVFVVLLTVLGIVFIIALRKRRPVIKVVMPSLQAMHEEPDEPETTPTPAAAVTTAEATTVKPEPTVVEHTAPAPAPEPEPDTDTEADEEDDDEESLQFVTEGQERVRYNRSLTAKIHQLSDRSKEWYTQLKNELLSYDKVKVRMSWRRETFRIGRMTIAKFIVRGKTLCLLFPVEPASFDGTKFSVRDVSNVASMADTPTMYRIRKERRCKYAKEMIADIMKEIKVYKNPAYVAQDYFLPYEGDMSLMQRGLVKRVVTGTTKTFKIEEVNVDKLLNDAAAAIDETSDGDGKKA